MNVVGLLRKKALRRIALLAVLVAPIIYLFGTQIGALAGAHGQEILAEDVSYFGAPVSNVYTGNQSAIEFENNFFGITALYGNSMVEGTTIVGSNSTAYTYSYGQENYSVDLPNVNLYSAGIYRDKLEDNGQITRNIGILDLGNARFSKDGDFWYTRYVPQGQEYNSVTSTLVYSDKNTVRDQQHWYKSGAGLFEVYAPSATSTADVQEIFNGIQIAYRKSTVTYEETTPFKYRHKSISPVSISLNSSVPQVFEFTYWQDVQRIGNYRDDLFGNFFGKSNFLTEWGQRAIDNSAGLPPVNQLLKFIAEDGLNIADSNIGLMGIGYATYILHAIMIYEFVALAIELLTIPLKIGDWFTKGVNRE